MIIRSLSIITISLLILFSCNSNDNSKGTSSKYTISIDHDTLYQEKDFSIQDSSDTITLQVYLSKLNQGVLRYRYKGNSPLLDQIPKLDTLLSVISNDTLIDFDFNTLFWGRLNDSKNHDFTLAKRLVQYAEKSNKWNKKLGRPVSGDKNGFLNLLQKDFSIELTPLLKKYGYTIKSVSAEKVLVYPAENLSFWNDIKGSVNPQDKLPFDCQLWFELSKIQK